MIFIRLILILSASLATAHFAQANVAATPDESCRLTTGDQYETPSRITSLSKRYSGKCLNTNRFRPTVVTEINPEKIVFANYRHENTYWKAELSKTAKIEATYFQVVRFATGIDWITAAHTQFRVRFAPGHELQLTSQTTGQVTTTRDLVISVEAARPENVDYNFAVGARPNYVLVVRGMSGEQRLAESTKNTTEQYELSLSQTQSMELVTSAINKGSEDKFSLIYDTFRPNCTTAVFDLIDDLSSLKNRNHRPWNPMISNDPVAGPSIQALADRGILKGRFANLRNELENGETAAPSSVIKKSQVNLLPVVAGLPYALVLVSSENIKNTKIDKELKKSALQIAPRLIHQLGSSMMLSGSASAANVLSAFKDVAPQMKQALQGVQNQMGGQTATVALYFVPWDKTGREFDMVQDLGLPAQLPVKAYETTYSPKVIAAINKGQRGAITLQSAAQQAFGLTSAALHFYLSQDNSKISLQVLGAAGPLEKSVSINNEQARISKAVIPPAREWSRQTMALIDLSQNLATNQPKLEIRFGPYGGLAGTADPSQYAKLQIDSFDCKQRRKATPQLQGKVASFGVIKLWFDIFAMELDLEKQQVKDMDVRVTTGTAITGPSGLVSNCKKIDPEINAQFTDNVNQQISDFEAKLGSSPGLSLFREIFNNNSEGLVSGF